MELNSLERGVLTLLLAGDEPVLAALRAQLAVATVTSRKYTGVGFYTHFSVPDNVSRTSPLSFVINDVFGTFENEIVTGFPLFVRNGTVTCLEGFVFNAEAWPSEDWRIEPYYMHHDPPSSATLRRYAERDMEQLRASWSGEKRR